MIYVIQLWRSMSFVESISSHGYRKIVSCFDMLFKFDPFPVLALDELRDRFETPFDDGFDVPPESSERPGLAACA